MSESVCQKLGIIQYHSLVNSVKVTEEIQGRVAKRKTKANNKSEKSTAKVKMIHTVGIPANHAAVIPVQISGKTGPLLLKPDPALAEKLDIGDSLLQSDDNNTTAVTVLNHSGSTCLLKKGENIGTVCGVCVINSHPDDESLLDTASESDTEAESVSIASETSFGNDGL